MKMIRFCTVLLTVFLATLSTVAQRAENLPDLIEEIQPSVVSVVAFDSSGSRLSSGTGFVVGNDKVITNYHVIEGATRVEVRTSDRKAYRVLKTSPASKDADLAILQVEDGPFSVKALRVTRVVPRVGEKVIVLGSPLGLTGTVTDGIVSAFRSLPKLGKLIQITAPISPGSSGSPVVNLNGEVVGLVTMDLKGGQNLNFAIASESLFSFWPLPESTGVARPSRTSSGSSRWRFLDTNMSYDTETFSKNAGIVSAWIKYDGSDGSYSKVLTEINCNTSRIRSVRSFDYSKSSNLPRETEGNGLWAPLIPESRGEVAYEVFCKDKRDYQSSLDYRRYLALYDEGTTFQREEKYEAAIDAYKKMITELPDYAGWGFAAIARVKLLQGNVRHAKNAILEAIKIDPLDIDNYSTLADVYKEEKQYQFAITNYWKVLRSNEEDANRFGPVLGLKEIYEERKDLVGLTTLYTFANGKGEAYYEELADIYDKRKMPALAKNTRLAGVKHFEKAVSESNVTVGDYYKLLNLLEALDDYAQLQSTAVRARKLFPSDGFLVHSLAEAHNKHRNWQKTVELIDESLPYKGWELLLLYRLKDAFFALGRKDDVMRIQKKIDARP
jgi:S1-C subfamily serine protease